MESVSLSHGGLGYNFAWIHQIWELYFQAREAKGAVERNTRRDPETVAPTGRPALSCVAGCSVHGSL